MVLSADDADSADEKISALICEICGQTDQVHNPSLQRRGLATFTAAD
jgi:hypothetical protein